MVDMKSLLGLLKKPSPPAAVLRAQLADMPTAIETAERRADELEAKRRGVLLEGSDDDLAKIEAEIAAANRQVERLFAAQSELERRLAAADCEAAEAERQARYEAAKQASADAAKALRRYPGLAGEILGVLETVARAEAAVNQANSDRPPDTPPLPSAEIAVRGQIPGGPYTKPLAYTLSLPGLQAGDPFLWLPTGPDGHAFAAGSQPDVILARLAESKEAA